MNRKEMKMLLEERFERIALLETRIDTMEQLVDGFREREQSIIDTLHSAKKTAARMVDDARAEAAEIRDQAQKEKESLLTEAKAAADAVAVEAQWQATELRAAAKAESDRTQRDAEITKREYEELVASFNAMLAQNASELQQTAARFAEFVKERRIEPSDLRVNGGAFYKSVGEMNDSSLPDPGDDPATLMQNIYRLQNRPLPGAEDAAPEEEKRAPEQAADAEAEADHAPYSETAWANEKQQSASEPQAEFASAFENAFEQSTFEAQPDGCAEPRSEAEHAFDEYFSAQQEPGDRKDEAKAAPEPYSFAAWNDAQHQSEREPQAEAQRAFDDFFTQAAMASGAQAQPAASGEQPASEQSSFEQPAAEPASPVVYEGVRLDETPAPEPYSEAAWAHDAFTSGSEPQAEGAAAFDAFAGGSEPQAQGEAAFVAFLDGGGEPREWEPEREPDMGDIPTVSRFVPESGAGEDVSLDQLLDEIIRAGE
jgi:hypothetical protein